MLKHWQNSRTIEWDKKAARSADGGLLQSWAWGRFQEALGNAVYNVSDEDEKWLAQCIQLKAGNQWILSIPRGPVYAGEGEPAAEGFKIFMDELKKLAEERNCFLLRFDPPWKKMVKSSGIIKSWRERQPVHTLILDTSKPEEDLLKQMKSKWRYNIRLAEKKGVRVRWSNDEKDARIFADLVKKTSSRQEFAVYDAEYYQTMLRELGDQASLLIAEHDGRAIAGLLIAFFGKFATYLHGASDYQHRNLMAPHLLQWEAIKEAKKRGLNYDFWGIASDPPANKQEEKWAGVTRFKKGFAPDLALTEYCGTYEMPVSRFKYLLYRLRQRLKSV